VNLASAVNRLMWDLEALSLDLRSASEQHAAEHDVFHMCRMLSTLCQDRIEELAPLAERVGAPLREQAERSPPSETESQGGAASAVDAAGSALLEDLRGLLLTAHMTDIDWIIVHQGAQSARDLRLVEASQRGMTEVERIVRWLTSRIREAAPQLLASGSKRVSSAGATAS
jgi:hypothetical protein